MSTLPPRVVFVTRETELDLLLARHATREQAKFFLETRGQDLGEVEARHLRQEEALGLAVSSVPDDWQHAAVSRRNLDRFLFTPQDILVAIGQDGLVANMAKYLSGQKVLGVNPAPDQYDGVLVRFSASEIGKALIRAHADDCEAQARTMVEGRLDTGETLLALNELFVGHQSHQSARYEISDGESSEQQSSSGVIIASGTGSTGWARSIMLATGTDISLNPTHRELGWFVREPFPSVATGTQMRAGRLGRNALSITSRMNDAGVVFADGIEHDFLRFGWGQTLDVYPSKRSLNLIVA